MAEQNTPHGLRYEDIVVGEGAEVKGRGDTVKVHYTGWLEDGEKFDCSLERDTPLSFPVDVGYVIKGWDEGIKGMRVGGKRKLIIPPDLGYGSHGTGDVVPPNATLTFEVELLEISR